MQGLNGYSIEDKILFAGPFRKRSEREAERKRLQEQKRKDYRAKFQGVNLFIKNLDDSIDEDRLRHEFSKFGNITSVKVCSDHCSIIHAETRRYLVI